MQVLFKRSSTDAGMYEMFTLVGPDQKRCLWAIVHEDFFWDMLKSVPVPERERLWDGDKRLEFNLELVTPCGM